MPTDLISKAFKEYMHFTVESPPTGAEIDVFQSKLSVMVEIITEIVDLVLLM